MVQKLLVPDINAESPSDPPEQNSPAPEASNTAAPDRYREVLCGLLDEAVEGKTVGHLVEALATALAIIAFRSGPDATGRMFHQFGASLRMLVAQHRAATEASIAKQQGGKSH